MATFHIDLSAPPVGGKIWNQNMYKPGLDFLLLAYLGTFSFYISFIFSFIHSFNEM